ncbi:hypothetical protein PPYR_06068 [Photinus pyralis]|uniref:Enolase n=1 Tax=Photinus pyralis TaxID=7054 RepID=A0A1Y1LHC1_PHOPY|nr:enolase-like [Photinus pyralis]KAB0800328.1 hypothetical protein PPYR_06068 [Photinus pyralis]
MPIKSVYARQVINSSGQPTVEVDLVTDLGLFRAAVSSEEPNDKIATHLKDGEPRNFYGISVLKAVTNVNQSIGPALVKQGYEVTQQRQIDELMIKLDGTENKSNFGANAILGVSMAVAKAGAAKRGIPLYKHLADLSGNRQLIIPTPAFSVIAGGILSSNKVAMQDIMILPTGAHTFAEALKMGAEVRETLKGIIGQKFGKDATAVNAKGAFVPNFPNDKDALKCIVDAIGKAGYTGRVELALDCAATTWYKQGKYDLNYKNPKSDKAKWLLGSKLQDTYYRDLMKTFPIVSLEDPFIVDDIVSWNKMLQAYPSLQIVGDTLTLMNQTKIQEVADKKACNCVLIKLNQIGTVTETIDAHLIAKQNGVGSMVAHGLHDTADSFIADLAVGLATGQIKTGGLCKSECVAKYNQILRIEEELASNAKYAGRAFRCPV